MFKSYRVIESVSSGPMPGMEKKRSTSREPPIVSMKEVGRFCTIGTNAFLRTCLNIIWRVERPFIRASFI